MAFKYNRELKTVRLMIEVYCRHHHGKGSLCPHCTALAKYARERLEKCFFPENKPVCSKCPVHCYKPEMRVEIKKVMRYAGPCMIYRHPVLAILHLFDKRRPVPVHSNSKVR